MLSYTMSEENTSGELGEIIHKLKQDGLDTKSTDQEKVIHLWRLYTKSESNLKAALAKVTELQEQQAEEMREFENYVEHVRKLSAEREALTVEFAAENDQLKAENDQLRQELESFRNEEIKDMLLQQGLDDIADGTTSEQIAFLLVERARLQDLLEAEEQHNLVETPDGLVSVDQLLRQIEQERQDFEEELRQQREMMNKSIQDLKSSHEEEIAVLVAENQQLQAMLNDVKSQLAGDTPNVKSSEEFKTSDANESSDMLSLEERAKQLEKQNWNYRKEIEQLQIELQREKARAKEHLDDYEETLRKLREEKNEQKEYIAELQVKNQKLSAEKKSSDLKMNFMEKELEDLREQQRNQVNKQKSLVSSDDNTHLMEELQLIKKEKKNLEGQLEETNTLLVKEKQNVLDFQAKVKDAEEELIAKNAKVKVLESQIKFLEDRMATDQQNKKHETKTNNLALQETMSANAKLAEEIGEHKQQNILLQLEIDTMKKHTERLEETNYQLQKENDDLIKKLREARNNLEIDKALLEERDKYKEKNVEKDIQLNEAYTELEKLQKELHQVRSELHNKESQLAQAQLELDKEKAKAEYFKETSEKQTTSLREQLEEALIENQKLKKDIAEKMKLLDILREEISKLRSTDVTLESSVPESDMAWFNKETKKLTSQNKAEDLYKRIIELESKNETLRRQLEQTQLELSNTREELAILRDQQGVHPAQTQFTVNEHMSNPGSDAKYFGLQQELIETRLKLEYAERDLKEMASVKEQLSKKQAEIIQLQNQLQEEKFNRSLAGIGSDEINNQLMATRQREHKLQQKNTELQLKLVELETKLNAATKQTESSIKVQDDSEQSKKSLMEQVSFLTKEVDILQRELISLSDKYDQQLCRYNERRNKTKTKLQKARDMFNAEKTKLRSEVEKLQKELSLTKLSLKKELEWKDSIDNKYHTLLLEKRDLLYQLAEQDELVRDHRRQLSVLQVRSKFLEEENNTLQQRIDSLNRQKQNLDRMIKDYQFERHKEELHRIVSLSAMALISPRNVTRTQSYDLLQAGVTGHRSNIESSLSHSLEALVSPRISLPSQQNDRMFNNIKPNLQGENHVDDNTDNVSKTDMNNTENTEEEVSLSLSQYDAHIGT